MLKCEYDDKRQCKGCELNNNCLLKTGETPTLRQVQNHIKDLFKLIDQAETDIRTIDQIQRFIDEGLYEKQRNIHGDPILEVSDVANYPPRDVVADELEDLRYELKLYRRKEFELIKEIGDKL